MNSLTTQPPQAMSLDKTFNRKASDAAKQDEQKSSDAQQARSCNAICTALTADGARTLTPITHRLAGKTNLNRYPVICLHDRGDLPD
jgi:hypothetical protein